MKTIRYISLITLILLSLACLSSAFADEAWDTIANTYIAKGNTKATEGTLIPTKDYGKVLRIRSDVGGWLRLTAPADGSFRLTVYCPDINQKSFQLPIHSDSRPAVQWPTFYRSSESQTYVFENVKAGETVFCWASKGNGKTFTGTFLMVVCFDGHHAVAGDPYTTEATCTQPATRVDVPCYYCSGDTEILAPAKGHSWGKEGCIAESTCTKSGSMGHTCTQCGEQTILYSLPALGHEAGQPAVVRKASCTRTGQSEVRCTRCDTLLYTLTLPTTDHTASRTQTGSLQGIYYEYTACDCGYLMNVRKLGNCPHTDASLVSQDENDLSVESLYYCHICRQTYTDSQPSGSVLIIILLTCVCALLLLFLLGLVIATLLTAFRPKNKSAAPKPSADMPVQDIAVVPAESSEGRDK